MANLLAKNDTETRDVQMVQLLETVSVELNALAGASEQLQSMISEVLGGNESEACALIYKLQDLDRITQTLNALGGFMRQVSEKMPLNWEIEVLGAMRSLTLADLASRLAPFHLEAELNNKEDAEGDCFFL